MNYGDIILIPFPFSDLSSSKVSPAVVVGFDNEDITVIFITSKKITSKSQAVERSVKNNLKVNSYIRYSKFASLDKNISIGRIGKLGKDDYELLKQNIKNYLDL